jgi:hypothetical protein
MRRPGREGFPRVQTLVIECSFVVSFEDLRTGDVTNDIVPVGFACFEVGNHAAEVQDADVVADLKNVGEVVADDDDSEAVVSQTANEVCLLYTSPSPRDES